MDFACEQTTSKRDSGKVLKPICKRSRKKSKRNDKKKRPSDIGGPSSVADCQEKDPLSELFLVEGLAEDRQNRGTEVVILKGKL